MPNPKVIDADGHIYENHEEIEDYFERNFGIEFITTACEYLADQGLIGKASTAVKITKRSNIEVQELAFVYLGEPPDEF